MLKGIKILAAAALLALGAATVTAIELPVTTLNGHQYYYYDVQPGETLFTLAKKLGISREKILEENPSVADGLTGSTRLYFNTDHATGITPIVEPTRPEAVKTHTVKKGETLYGISRQYGIGYDNLLAMNPSARDGIRPGEVLVIETEEETSPTDPTGPTGLTEENIAPADPTGPSGPTEENIAPAGPTGPSGPTEENIAPADPTGPSGPTEENIAPADPIEEESSPLPPAKEEYNIAVILPLMLAEEKPSRTAEMFTDFYKGFLLAAKELSSGGEKINIRAYDSAGSLDAVKNIMALPELKSVDLVIGPDNTEQFDYIVSAVDEDNTFVINTFATKSEAHLNNPQVIQTNLPREQMYAKAINAFMEENAARKPVIISRIGGSADKEEFTSQLKARLEADGREYTELTFNNVLTEADLEKLAMDSAYVFVPISGSRSEFIKIIPALKRFKEVASAGPQMALFGYPEWLMFRGDMADNLNATNAMIYSRFFEDSTNYPTRKLADNFTAIYGKPMIESVPSQALLGYDTANFAIRGLRRNHGDFHADAADYEGLQTIFKLDDSDVEGLVNTSLLLIKFGHGSTPQIKKI